MSIEEIKKNICEIEHIIKEIFDSNFSKRLSIEEFLLLEEIVNKSDDFIKILKGYIDEKLSLYPIKQKLFEQKIYINYFNLPQIPVELLDFQKNVAIFGANIYNFDGDCFQFFENDFFTNGIEKYNLTSLQDLTKLTKRYEKIILTDECLYKFKIGNTNDVQKKLFDTIYKKIISYNETNLKRLENNPTEQYKIYIGKLFAMKQLLFTLYNPNLFYNKGLLNELIYKINYFYSFYYYDSKWQSSGPRSEKEIQEHIKILENSDENPYIEIRVSNIKNKFQKNFDGSNGILRFSKTLPCKITPINLNNEEKEFIQSYFKEFSSTKLIDIPYLFNILTYSAKSLDDLFYLNILYKDNLKPIFTSFQLEQPINDNSIHYTEYYEYNTAFYKLFNTYYRQLDSQDAYFHQSLYTLIPWTKKYWNDSNIKKIKDNIMKLTKKYEYITILGNYLSFFPEYTEQINKVEDEYMKRRKF